ncbi:hypothetical protein GCM10022291_14180 [Postechiella marina]|uniref:PA14 domain-containing protein n=1 Tax=Postechiella marina TaxID=943941 RepID=A0ABP8C6D4_9FLAO
MKNKILYFLVLLLSFSCGKEEVTPVQIAKTKKKATVSSSLPFNHIKINDLSAFKPTGANWKVVGNVFADRTKNKTLYTEQGTGILINTNDQEKNKNIFTLFDHGDIELELDVMMPVKSNSGLYFQGRYEVQLFDSWGVEHPKYVDMGGIYQRWNKDAKKGKEGYEGYSPRVNAAKAPGLWQHIKVIFHAAKFDESGKKTKNAWFEEVWLNGVLIHENIELSGPTRGGGSNANEKPRGPLMIQGDHGPVAFKNIKYKLYEGNTFILSNLNRSEYKNVKKLPVDLDTIAKTKEEKVNSFSLVDVTSSRDRKMVTYSGMLSVPESGQYLFEGHTNGNAELYLNNKKVLFMRGGMDKAHIKTIALKKGDIPFKVIYNQHAPWSRGFSLHVEGPNMQKYSLQEGVKKGEGVFDPLKGIIIEVKDKPIMQRSFVNHEGLKHTHCISVGTPQGIHYSYNLATGSLLKIWSGSFLNTTHMWLSRGQHQLGEPIGFSVSLHGDLEIVALADEHTKWPQPLPENKSIKQLGYELDNSKMPSFSYQIGKSVITNKYSVPKGNRQLKKSIKISNGKNLWHKIADGVSIKALPNNTYIINNESYYIDFSGNNIKPIIRNIDNKDELLVEIPEGDSTINYSIIW